MTATLAPNAASNPAYLFRLRTTKNVSRALRRAMAQSDWSDAGQGSARPITTASNSRYDMPGSQITVTDGETGHKGEIKSVNDAPPLYAPDQKSRSDHCK